METVIRPAKKEDVSAMLSIYAPYVRETAVTFEYEVPSENEFIRRLDTVMTFYPWLVCEENGKVTGYAYASCFHERKAYQWDVEMSIYMEREARHRGNGRKLYETLFSILKAQGIYILYAHITYPNDASIAFHEAMGFERTAHFSRTGYKLGRWRDTVFMEKRLGELPKFPKAPRGWKEIKENFF